LGRVPNQKQLNSINSRESPLTPETPTSSLYPSRQVVASFSKLPPIDTVSFSKGGREEGGKAPEEHPSGKVGKE